MVFSKQKSGFFSLVATWTASLLSPSTALLQAALKSVIMAALKSHYPCLII